MPTAVFLLHFYHLPSVKNSFAVSRPQTPTNALCGVFRTAVVKLPDLGCGRAHIASRFVSELRHKDTTLLINLRSDFGGAAVD